MNKFRFVLYFLLFVPQIFICYFLYYFKVDINLIKLSIKDNKIKIVLFNKCENKPNTVYLPHPKTDILEPERCVRPGEKLIAEKFEYKIEGDKFIIDKPNLAILATNITQLRNAYEELKMCYTNQVDYYVAVANL